MSKYNASLISEEQELEIIDLFLNTRMSLRDIAKVYNRKSYDFVYRILQKHNINTKRRHVSNKISIEDISDIINLYKEKHMTARQIAKQYSVTYGVITRILTQNGIEIRKHYNQTFNENYFDTIDTSNKAYLLGFLYADGCINKNNAVSFTVHQQDREILEMYIKELQATNEITNIKTKPHVRISFCSKHMCDTLINMGCIHNKTYNLTFPDISSEYYYDFIRGFMDGDGCISTTNKNNHKYISLSFTGTKEMLNTLKELFKIDNQITFYRNAYSLHIGKSQDVLRILSDIYNNAELYMTRKFNKYKEYCNYIEKGINICVDQSA